LPDHERLPGGSVADPLWMNPGRTGLPGSASRGALPAVPTGAGGVVTTADIRAPCSWPPSGAGSHTPAGIDIPDADGLSVGVLPGDGQPRFVWDELAVTVADYMGVLVASVIDAAAGRLSTRPLTSRPRTWPLACVQPVPQPQHRPRKTRQSQGAKTMKRFEAVTQMSPPSCDRLWTVHDTSAFLGVPVATLHQWRYRGKGPQAFRVGRHLRYDPAVVRSWLVECCTDAAS